MCVYPFAIFKIFMILYVFFVFFANFNGNILWIDALGERLQSKDPKD